MFKLEKFYGLMDEANDGIILGMGAMQNIGGGSGAGGGADNKTPEEIEAEAEAARLAAAGGAGGNADLNELPADNAFQLEFLNDKYDDTSLLKLNANGDITNTDGEVLITKEALATGTESIKTEHVAQAKSYISSLDSVTVTDTEGKDVEGTINEAGDVVDKEGNVILKADDFINNIMEGDEYMEYDPNEVGVFEAANKITGFDLLDEQGNVLEFDETPAGVAARDLHIAKTYGNNIAQEQINTFFATNPEIEDFYNYTKARGSSEGYGTQTNHEGITIDPANEQQHIDLIVEAEMMRGNSKERAISIANLFKDNDKAHEEAKGALAYMQGAEKAAKAKDAETVRINREATAAAQQEYWEGVQTVLDAGKLKDINIPKNIKVKSSNGVISTKTIQDFYNYISKDVGNGLTQEQVDAGKDDLETKLMYQYLRFTGHDFDYLVSQRATQQNVRSFKNKHSKNNVRVPRGSVKVNTGSTSGKIVLSQR